ncbi:phage portal protein [Paraburkholderia panacisoli]|uniref:Phage portal protein n=1 Tax=Paraburkholderia panacisoli TaxID=2603818 RepID=A0A5B0HL06_9BURK|nr:phage portal protein [Paraburkholderia panacisoli]KAA1015966.1 phage portal protein [Paraburkholderia panacisoli]
MFLSIRADGGDSGDRSPWGEFWFAPVPFRGTKDLNGEQAMRLTAVYACVRVLAESISMLPFVLYTEADSGAKTPNRNHWLYKLFAVRPNDYQNPMEFREMLQGHVALRGNAFARIYSNPAGEVTDLIPLHPDRITIEMLSDTNWRYRVRNRDNSETILNRGDVFHLRGLSSDGIIGLSPIEAARESIATALAAQDYGMRYFQNDATPGGWVEFPGQFKTDEQRNLWREQFQKSQTGRHRHKTAVLEMGMKYHPIQITNSDAQYLETRKYSVGEIARLFRIPPHLIGDLERATFSNIEQQSLEFVLYTLTPWLTRWEESIRYTFLEPQDGLNVEFPFKAMLRGDAAARAAYYHNGILDGWMTRNEARLAESMNPLDGLDEPLRPLNMVEENEAEKAENEPPETPEQKPPGNLPAPPQPTNAPGVPKVVPKGDLHADMRFFALARANAERIARKETAMVQAALRAPDSDTALVELYEKHVTFIEQALSVPRDEALAYCTQRLDFLQTQGRSIEVDLFNDSACMQLTRLALEGTIYETRAAD